MHGFPVVFFRRFWKIVSEDVTTFCLRIMNEGKSLEDANATKIVLLPKISNLTTSANYKPINLCTVVYKLVAKVLVNRFQVIEKCIDYAQIHLYQIV